LSDQADKLYPPYDYTANILTQMGILPDFESTGQIRYTHRTMNDCEIYFLSNRTNQPVAAECKFRATGARPELWDPMTGEMRLLPEFMDNGNHTTIPLKFDIYQGYFVVFRAKSSLSETAVKKNFPEQKQLTELNGPWDVSFDPAWGGPENITFEQLIDWTHHADQGVKYYSGTAIYRKTFDITVPKNCRIFIDLGKVKNMARVKLNGKDLGVVWTAPWSVDITKAVKKKGNRLEREVVNLWPNSLIGDENLPNDGINNGQWPEWLKAGTPRTSGRYTFTTYRHFRKDSPLLESGLLGPVSIKSLD
jgi:hypothetical protein